MKPAKASESAGKGCSRTGDLYKCQAVTMEEVALRLTQLYYITTSARDQGLDAAAGLAAMWPDRPVIDKTGLVGAYDFSAEFAADSADASGPPAVLNVIKRVGLALEPAKQALDVLVIDHVEKTPTEN